MDFVSIVHTMRERMPWSVGQIILRDNKIPRHRGWDNTVQHLVDNVAKYDNKTSSLEKALREHHLSGEKLVRFYDVNEKQIRRLRREAPNLRISKNIVSRSYPSQIDEDDLSKQPLMPRLISVETTEDGIGLVFASVRVLTTRETISFVDLPKDVAESLGRPDEIVVLKHKRVQASDVVWISHHGTIIDIRVDFPDGMPQEVGEAVHEALRKSFNELAGSDMLEQPINLFPLIDQIYRRKNEGTVVELAFSTTTASTKHEKMRRNSLCLRDEIYHLGGKKALATPIEPYRLSVTWDKYEGDKRIGGPELSLNGTARMAGAAQPFLSSAIISNCVGLADFEDVRSRIISLLPT